MPRVTDRDQYLEEMRQRLDDVRRSLARMEEHARRGPDQAREEYREAKHALAVKEEKLRQEIDRAIDKGEDAWKEIRSGVENAWSELKQAAERARVEFQEENPSTKSGG